MNLFAKLFARSRNSARPAARSARLALESLDARDMPSASPLAPVSPAAPSIVAKLPGSPTNMNLPQLAKWEFKHDGSITMKDAITLFQVADGSEKAIQQQGETTTKAHKLNTEGLLTAATLDVLRSIANHPVKWGLNTSTATFMQDVVDVNAANKRFLGAKLVPGGRLKASDPDWMMADLVDKWGILNQNPLLSIDLMPTDSSDTKQYKIYLYVGPGADIDPVDFLSTATANYIATDSKLPKGWGMEVQDTNSGGDGNSGGETPIKEVVFVEHGIQVAV
jgi:hypothetical protein